MLMVPILVLPPVLATGLGEELAELGAAGNAADEGAGSVWATAAAEASTATAVRERISVSFM
jgi:hypothetical protein